MILVTRWNGCNSTSAVTIGWKQLLLSTAFCALLTSAHAGVKSDEDQCLLDALMSSDESTTVSEIRRQCRSLTEARSTDARVGEARGVVSRRIAAEADILERAFVLTAHRPNYVLPYTYNSRPNEDAFRLVNPSEPMDSAEAQFQVSFKFPLAQQFMGPNNDLFFSFTSRAWWQVYNDNLSSPFRETDYEPELFIRHFGGPQMGPIKIAGWDLGLAHQSNGQSKPLSRSWNRVNANLALETGNIALALRTWYRLPESTGDDDNPHLYRYLGYGDVRVLYSRRNHVFTAMYRPGTDKSAYEFTWSMPLWQQLRLYLTYFDGYGESLLDYNHRNKRIGIGFGLNDYLDTSTISR